MLWVLTLLFIMAVWWTVSWGSKIRVGKEGDGTLLLTLIGMMAMFFVGLTLNRFYEVSHLQLWIAIVVVALVQFAVKQQSRTMSSAQR